MARLEVHATVVGDDPSGTDRAAASAGASVLRLAGDGLPPTTNLSWRIEGTVADAISLVAPFEALRIKVEIEADAATDDPILYAELHALVRIDPERLPELGDVASAHGARLSQRARRPESTSSTTVLPRPRPLPRCWPRSQLLTSTSSRSTADRAVDLAR